MVVILAQQETESGLLITFGIQKKVTKHKISVSFNHQNKEKQMKKCFVTTVCLLALLGANSKGLANNHIFNEKAEQKVKKEIKELPLWKNLKSHDLSDKNVHSKILEEIKKEAIEKCQEFQHQKIYIDTVTEYEKCVAMIFEMFDEKATDINEKKKAADQILNNYR